MNKRYLIVDLDDTVLDFKGGEIADVKEVFKKHCGLTQDADLENALKVYQKINKQLWTQYELKEIKRDTIFSTRYQTALDELGLSGDAAAMEKDYATLRDQNYRVLDGAEELLASLSKDYTVLVGTNGQDETQRRRLRETDFAKYFDKIYTSEEIGAAKPDEKFYQAIFNDNPDMTKENTAMIGDGVFSDMLGGQRYGIDTLWVNLDGKLLPEDINVTNMVTSLTELKELLAKSKYATKERNLMSYSEANTESLQKHYNQLLDLLTNEENQPAIPETTVLPKFIDYTEELFCFDAELPQEPIKTIIAVMLKNSNQPSLAKEDVARFENAYYDALADLVLIESRLKKQQNQ